MKSCYRNRMILLSVAVLGICSIGGSEGFFLRNLLSETHGQEEIISVPTTGQLIPNTTHIVIDETHRNVSEKLEKSSTQIVNSVRSILTSVLDDHAVDKSTNVPEENNQIDVDVKNSEVPSSENAVEERQPKDAEVSIVKLPEEDSEDSVVTVLEENIRSSINDETQLMQNESSAIDVIDEIPDPEVRQILTEDLMAIEYPQIVKKPEETGSVYSTTIAASVKQDIVSVTESIVEVTTVQSQEVTSADFTPDALLESTTINPVLVEETTIIPSKAENSHALETLEDPNEVSQVLTRQMRGFDEESESDILGQSSENSSDNTSSYSSGLSVSDMLESTTRDENVGAEETSAEIDAVVPQDASIEGGFQKETTIIQEISLPKISPTPKPYTVAVPEVSLPTISPTPKPSMESVSETPTTIAIKVPESPILIEQITESTIAELNEIVETAGDGNHVVVGRHGVEDELSLGDGKDSYVPLEVEIASESVTTEKTSTLSHNEDQGRNLPNNEEISIEHKPDHDNLIDDEDSLPQNAQSDAEISLREHSEPAKPAKPANETAKDFAEVDVAPTKEPTVVDQSKPTLPTSEHQELNGTERQNEPLLQNPSDFTQQLTDIPRNHQEAVNEEAFPNPMYITEPIAQNDLEISTEKPMTNGNEKSHQNHEGSNDPSGNEIFKEIDEALPIATPDADLSTFATPPESTSPANEDHPHPLETSTEKSSGRSNEDETTSALVYTLIEAAELTTEFARHVDSFRATRDETAAISDEIISTAAAGRSFNAIVAEGLGKPLPTRSVGDAPSTSSYSSEDKTTTVVVLCTSAAIIFIAFSVAMYLITFQRQHGTLDIEMQEQECGKDDLEEDEDAETRMTLLNQLPQADSDTHSFD